MTLLSRRTALTVTLVSALAMPQHAALLAQNFSGLKILVLEGEDGINIIEKKTAVKPVVEVRDKNDLPVAGAIVTFLVVGTGGGGPGATFANGGSEFSLVTNATGRAAIREVHLVGKGALQIQVRASYQGQVATATIHQTNFATAAEAAKVAKAPTSQGAQSTGSSTGSSGSAGGSSGAAGAGGAAATGGGLSAAAIGGIVAGAAGAGIATTVAVKNSNSNSNSTTKTPTSPPPTVGGVSASPSVGLQASTTISFSAQASDPSNKQLTFSWDFGDGGTSTGQAPTHVYHTSGTFSVRLTVNNGRDSANGQTSVTIKSLTGTWLSQVIVSPSDSSFTEQFTAILNQTDANITGTMQDTIRAGTFTFPCTFTITGGSVKTATPYVMISTHLTAGNECISNLTFSGDPSADLSTMTGPLNGNITATVTFRRQ